MKAAIVRRYGPPDVVTIADLPDPRPKPPQVLVRVSAAAVTVGDARIRAARAPGGMGGMLRLAFGLTRPRRPVLGMFLCGRANGVRVLGNTGMALGAHAEMVALHPDRILPVPEGLDDAEAAALLFGGLTAMDFLTVKSSLAPGQRVLVNGATGEVGLAALQLARHLGLVSTAVCRAENHATARDHGAQDCHDYRTGLPVGQWDAVLDLAGTLPWPKARGLLAEGGVLLPATASLGGMLGAALRPRRGTRRISGSVTADGPDAMRRLLALYAKGAFRPVVGARFALSDIRAAHALADSGHKRGSCVVLMDQASDTAMAAK